MKVGMRTIKTALAAVIAVFVSGLLGAESPFFAVIAAILTMQITVSDSIIIGKNRILGTFLGALVGIIGSLIAPGNPFLIGLGIVIIIYNCNLLKWNQAISIASVVFLSIILHHEDNQSGILVYSISRIIDTLLGISIGLLVNYFVSPPKLLDSIKNSIVLLEQEMKNSMKKTIAGEQTNFSALETMVNKLDHLFLMLKNDIRVHRRANIPLNDIDEITRLIAHARDHLRILATLENKKYIDDINQDMLESNYGIEPHNNDQPPGVEEMVYNYHLGKALDIINDIDKLHASTFPQKTN